MAMRFTPVCMLRFGKLVGHTNCCTHLKLTINPLPSSSGGLEFDDLLFKSLAT